MSLLANLIAKKKFILQLVSRAVLVGFLVMLGLTIYVYTFKNQIVQKLLTNTNKGYRGRVACGDVGVSLFRGFPYVSLTVNDLKVYENKKDTAPILSVEKSYFGFELLSLLQENYQIRKITFERGYAHIIQYNADEYNITRAFEPVETQAKDTAKSTLYLNIDALKLYDITIDKQNLETNIRIETEIKQLESKFSKSKEDIFLLVDTKFTLNAYKNQKPTYIYHKHFDAETKLTYHKASQIIDIDKALVKLEGSEFNMTGNIDTKGDMPVDLVFEAQKSDFNLVIAMAPEALIPTLSSYKNKANIKFLATIKGPTANNQQPQVNIDLKCQDAQIINPDINKKIDQIGFSLNFTNGKERNNKTSVLQLKDFFARPNIGKFKANLTVKNLDAPEIDMQLDTDFDLEFLSKFFRINQLSNLSGKVMLQMNFHDIIDIQNPQTSLDRFNQAYYAKLEVNNLNFKVNTYALPISNINIAAEMDAKKLLLKNLSLNVANSNIAINGFATNLPAIIHKTKDEIHSELHVKSNLIDLNQLTQNKIDEA
ncbi:MAG: hypothetical protein MUE53_08250, partial [Chitinophagales bacterium]|nr:hypothetical protein [Chitinophagales bacterium]